MKYRVIEPRAIKKAVKDLCAKANIVLREDVLRALKESYKKEQNTLAKSMLAILIENADIAKKEKLAICQDTGIVTLFIDIGNNVVINGSLKDAVNDGVKEAYIECNFRKSVVGDPILRNNTFTNTPCIIHTDIVEGKKLKISVMPKGFGSENKARIKMLNPTASLDEIIDFCVDTVRMAGPDACPPYILGIGLGGTMEKAAYLAKKALLRCIDSKNPKRHIAQLEKAIKEKANKLGIGIMGVGGKATVLGVNIEEAPTHIAGLPVAVNVSCHALRSASRVI